MPDTLTNVAAVESLTSPPLQPNCAKWCGTPLDKYAMQLIKSIKAITCKNFNSHTVLL